MRRMREGGGAPGIVAVLAGCILFLIVCLSVWVGWLIAGRVDAAVAVAVLLCVALLLGAAALGVRTGAVTVAFQPPSWLRRLDVATSDPVWSDGVQRAIALGAEEARHFRQERIGTEHLLLGLMREEGHAARALAARDVTFEKLIRAVDVISGVGDSGGEGTPALGPACRRALDDAHVIAREHHSRTIGTGHLLLALARESHDSAAAVLDHLGCTPAVLTRALDQTRRRRGT